MKLMVFGHARHGKDTAANVLARRRRCTALASSWVACEQFLFQDLRDAGHNYKTLKDAWDDRISSNEMRAFWYDSIRRLNADDPTRLMRAVYAQTDIYTGIRCCHELAEGIKTCIVDLAIWVDASERLPSEPLTSMTCTREQADIVIDNNGTEEEFLRRVKRLAYTLRVS